MMAMLDQTRRNSVQERFAAMRPTFNIRLPTYERGIHAVRKLARWFLGGMLTALASGLSLLFIGTVGAATLHVNVTSGPFAGGSYMALLNGDAAAGTFLFPQEPGFSGTYTYTVSSSNRASLQLNFTAPQFAQGDIDAMNLVFVTTNRGSFSGWELIQGTRYDNFSGEFQLDPDPVVGPCCTGGAGCCGGVEEDLRPYAFQFGEAQRMPGKIRILYRVAGQIFILLNSETERTNMLAELTGPGKLLDGYSPEFGSGASFILRAPSAEVPAQLACPASLQALIERARQIPGIRCASPVFLDLQENLRFMPADDYVVSLAPGADPESILPPNSAVSQESGTGEFIVHLPGVPWKEMIREINLLALDPRVEWVEPNYFAEGRALSADSSGMKDTPAALVRAEADCVPEPVRLSSSFESAAQNLTVTIHAIHDRIVTIQRSTPAGWLEVTNLTGGEERSIELPIGIPGTSAIFRALAY
jgi:hypothetical protein